MLSCVVPGPTNPLAIDLIAFDANSRVVLRAEARTNSRRGRQKKMFTKSLSLHLCSVDLTPAMRGNSFVSEVRVKWTVFGQQTFKCADDHVRRSLAIVVPEVPSFFRLQGSASTLLLYRIGSFKDTRLSAYTAFL